MEEIPKKDGFLPEQDGHSVFYTRYGNPDLPAVVVLHGGPGAKSKPKHIKHYNLKKFQIITFDQRGCGKSLPQGEISENTTQKLIEDIERLRTHLNIEKWFVAGGSWGSTLALAYAESHSDKVRGLLLSSIYLARTKDVQWFGMEGGVERMFPDVWEIRMQFFSTFNVTPTNATKVLLAKLLSADENACKEIAAGVANWENNLMSTVEDISYVSPLDMSAEDIASAKIFLHYEANDSFLEENQLLNNADALRSIPAVIVHGRFDVLCPPDSAWVLSKVFSNVKVTFLPSSAHRLTAEADVARGAIFNAALSEWTS